MDQFHVCCLCLARDDLLRITKERESLVSSIIHQELPKDVISRICINCSNILTCIDKFHDNSRAAWKILVEKKMSLQQGQNNLLGVSPETQDMLSAGFGNILNWLTEVNVGLRQITMQKDPEMTSDADTIMQEDVQNTTAKDNSVNVSIETSSNQPIEEMEIEKQEENVEIHVETKQMRETTTKSKKFLQDDNFNPDDYLSNNKKGTRGYKCPECDKYFSRNELIYHRNIHLGTKPYNCIAKRCSQAFYSPSSAAQHCKKHHKLNVYASHWTEINQKSNKEEDDTVNDDLEGLEEPTKMDEENSETQNEPQQLEGSLETEKSTSKLKKPSQSDFNPDDYLDKKKKGKERYKCLECGKYYSRLDLINHRKTHLGTKPYICNICSSEYMHQHSLKRHMEQKHKGSTKKSHIKC